MLLIVRHGRTVANASGLLQGRVDNTLDDLGLRQAQLIAQALGKVDLVVSSPLIRARETAEPLGLPLRIDERWTELDYGEWDERPLVDVSSAEWAEWRSDLSFAPPGGESLSALDLRVAAACEDLLTEARDKDVAVFTHVSPIKSAVAWALGVGGQISWRMNVAQAQITRIAIREDKPILVSFNETSHLSHAQ